jgi:alpha-L-fucosidase
MVRLPHCVAVISLLSLLSVASGDEPPPPQRAEFTQVLMGVQARVIVYATSKTAGEQAARAAFDRIAVLEQAMSDYRVDSEISALNRGAGGAPVRIGPDLWSVLKVSLSIAELTGGAFDPTIGPMVRLWRDARNTGRLPDSAAVGDCRARVGHAMLELDQEARTARLATPGMLLDLGGIGKGDAAQEAVKVLKKQGTPCCLVSLAGDIAAGDAPSGVPGWRIGVDTGYPDSRATIHIANQSCSTSGDAEQFIEIDGKRYSHIIDPATGLGSTRRVGACVVAEHGATADALATALAVVGVERAPAILARFPATAMIVESTGRGTEKFVSEGFPMADSMFDPQNQPPAGFFALFNGQDLSGWQGLAGSPPELEAMSLDRRTRAQSRADDRMREHWKVEDGILKFDGKGDSLQTARPFRDFELYVDWSIDRGGDSGIYLRGTPQVQIWDNPVGSGGIYNTEHDVSRPLAIADRAPGEWNRFHIIMKDDRVTVYLNGVLAADQVKMDSYWEPGKPLPVLGPIELQAHGNPLRFKNIFIREIHDATPPTPQDQRMAWWRDARFGMFIHWGLYAIPAGEWEGKVYDKIPSEWLMHHAKIKPEDYEKLAPQFNPVKFDANAWADLAREAGMKYVVITTKHHDGFCLFDSAYTTYDIMEASPFKRDIMKELSAAVRDKGMQMCWYHSIMDWHHPDATLERWDRYAPILRKQVEEILTKYGHIGVMWFDGEWEKEWDTEQGKAMYELCRKLQPDLVINNRVGKGRKGMQGLTKEGDHPGDFGTPEQEVPARGLPGVDWETCMTMNESWGFHRTDTKWKSAKTLIQMLADTASKGGNLLLNVGPTELGEISAASIERLRAMGAWMRMNAASIYGTEAGPFARLPWGRCTTKKGPSGTILYLHVFDWPSSGELQVPGLLNAAKRAYLLASPSKPLTWAQSSQGLSVRLPNQAPDANDSVVVLELIGNAAVVDSPLSQDADGSVLLTAADAQISGEHARFEAADDRRWIGFWTSEKDIVSWEFQIARPGKFQVELEFSCKEASAGSELKIQAGGASVPFVVPSTGEWEKFEKRVVGSIELPKGKHTLRLVPLKLAKEGIMNVRAVRLIP